MLENSYIPKTVYTLNLYFSFFFVNKTWGSQGNSLSNDWRLFDHEADWRKGKDLQCGHGNGEKIPAKRILLCNHDGKSIQRKLGNQSLWRFRWSRTVESSLLDLILNTFPVKLIKVTAFSVCCLWPKCSLTNVLGHVFITPPCEIKKGFHFNVPNLNLFWW